MLLCIFLDGIHILTYSIFQLLFFCMQNSLKPTGFIYEAKCLIYKPAFLIAKQYPFFYSTSINFVCIGTTSTFNFLFDFLAFKTIHAMHFSHRLGCEVITNPGAVFSFVHFIWPYEKTVIAKAIRLRPC